MDSAIKYLIHKIQKMWLISDPPRASAGNKLIAPEVHIQRKQNKQNINVGIHGDSKRFNIIKNL
jgi:hypothetical protein